MLTSHTRPKNDPTSQTMHRTFQEQGAKFSSHVLVSTCFTRFACDVGESGGLPCFTRFAGGRQGQLGGMSNRANRALAQFVVPFYCLLSFNTESIRFLNIHDKISNIHTSRGLKLRRLRLLRNALWRGTRIRMC